MSFTIPNMSPPNPQSESNDLRCLLREQAQESRELRHRLRRMERGAATLVGIAGLVISGYALLASGLAQAAVELTTCNSAHDLFCFTAGSPAKAAQVNANFESLASRIDAANTTAASAASAAETNARNAATTALNGFVNNDSLRIAGSKIYAKGSPAAGAGDDLGLYSQISGGWMRFVTNGAPFKFFTSGGYGTDADLKAVIDVNGKMLVHRAQGGATNPTYQVDSPVIPDGACVIMRDTTASCPAGWSLHSVRFDTEDSGNGDVPDATMAPNDGSSTIRMKFCCQGF